MYSGDGNYILLGGKGNDTIYTGSGTNTVVISKGDGNDTMYAEGDKTTVKINSAKVNDSIFYNKKDVDLLLTYSHAKSKTKEIITLKNYFNDDGSVRNSEVYLETLSTVKISDVIPYGIVGLMGAKSSSASLPDKLVITDFAIDTIKADVAGWQSSLGGNLNDYTGVQNIVNNDLNNTNILCAVVNQDSSLVQPV